MQATFSSYDLTKSVQRIDEIIAAKDEAIEEVDTIPSRDRLTFTNGFYVNCSALFIDIRGSSDLADKHRRPKLARLYRSFLSECVAVMNGSLWCAEVDIVGDCVSGIFNGEYKSQINDVFSAAARLSSLVDILNCKYKRAGMEEITVGIGASWGRGLMIKAGYSGSGINDVVWMGEVVNEASRLCSYGNASWSDAEIMVSDIFYNNLNENNQKLLTRNSNRSCYHGNVIIPQMNDWYQENCLKKE